MADLLCDWCGASLAAGLQGRFFPEDDSFLCVRCFAFSEVETAPTPARRDSACRPLWPRVHPHREKQR
jgi:hypothetical protein